MTPKTLKILAELSDNLRGEHDAIRGYYKMLDLLPEQSASKTIQSIGADIEEIISDEMNHCNKLQGLIDKLSTIKAATV